MLEQKAAELASERTLKSPFHFSAGLEATRVGSMMELRAGDAVSSDPMVVSQLMSGQPMGLVLAELCGLRSQYLAFAPDAPSGAIHILPTAETLEARLNIAAGYAIALRRASSANVVLVHLSNGFSGLGYWHQAARAASAERLPLIFVAVSESVTSNGAGTHALRERAAGYGIPGIIVDGNDLVAVWRVAQESIHRARSGSGPTLIDAQIIARPTNSHFTAEGDDPIARMQHYLQKRKLWNESWKGELVRKFTAEVDEAVSFVKRAQRDLIMADLA